MILPNIVANSYDANSPDPIIGMGVTEYMLSDRYPYTVIEVISNKKIVVQQDNYRADPKKAMGIGHQNWIIEPNLKALQLTLSKRKDGKWRQIGEKSGRGIMRTGFVVGIRNYYYCWEL